MLSIAKRAGASKETLYSWFSNKEGLFAALIESNGEHTATRVREAMTSPADPRQTLQGFGQSLLRLLVSEPSISLNRAAMSSPALSAVLLENGRHRVGPIVENYLQQQAEAGLLSITDPAASFQALYGLIVCDYQIRVLLGEKRPTPSQISAHVTQAVDNFLQLVAPVST